MNLISIDSAKAHIGIYIKTDKEYYFTITTTGLKNDGEKYLKIFDEVENCLILHKIEVAFLEDYPFHIRNSSSVTALAEVKGILLYLLAKLNIPVIKVVPSTWQALVKINLPKKQSSKEYIKDVNIFYKKEFKTTDECDAYMMMLSMFYIFKGVVKTDSHLKIQKKMKAIGKLF